MIIQQITNYTEFWRNVVTPDHEEFKRNTADLRLAFHTAISLFHMSDWVYWGNTVYIQSQFNFKDKNGTQHAVGDDKQFANALRDLNSDFELIRGIANAAKHLELKRATKIHHPNAPSHAANTAVQTTGYGQGSYGAGPYGGTSRVMLQGPNGADLEFLDLAQSVHDMWTTLGDQHGWTL